MSAERFQWGRFLDRWAARPMFLLALAYLIVLAGATHRLKDMTLVSDLEVYLLAGALVGLFPVFFAEGLIRFLLRVQQRRPWTGLLYGLALFLAPPLRLGSRGYARIDEIWLPFLGWRTVDKHLRRRLEQFFSMPMIVLALLTLPLLAVEYYWQEQISTNPTLALIVDVSTSFIWLAFAFEFIVQSSLAERKWQYVLYHWVDLLIVLLPLVDALPVLRSLRAFQILRMQQLTRLGRAYRMKAVAMKLWRAVLVLEVIQRLTGSSKAKRLRRLKELLRAKEEELGELREEIAQLEGQLSNEEKASPQGEVEPAA
jgi:voltage-gated potassium channel